jgi:hypothetical protein
MKIPKNETGMTVYVFDDIECYKITRNTLGKYTLYKIIGDNDYQKMKTADSPLDLEKIIDKDRRN